MDNDIPEKKESKKSSKKSSKINAAIVRNGRNEVRRYTLYIHGENFEELANEFAQKRDYEVELAEIKPGKPCPACGHMIYL